MTVNRRMLGLDYGRVRIGIATSDPTGTIARPYGILTRKSKEDDFAYLLAVANQLEIARIIIGLPTEVDGGIGPQARVVIRWGRQLAGVLGRPVVFWDETHSSREAAIIRKNTGTRRRTGHLRRREPLDHIAAATILQDYLNAGETNGEPGYSLETFFDIK